MLQTELEPILSVFKTWNPRPVIAGEPALSLRPPIESSATSVVTNRDIRNAAAISIPSEAIRAGFVGAPLDITKPIGTIGTTMSPERHKQPELEHISKSQQRNAEQHIIVESFDRPDVYIRALESLLNTTAEGIPSEELCDGYRLPLPNSTAVLELFPAAKLVRYSSRHVKQEVREVAEATVTPKEAMFRTSDAAAEETFTLSISHSGSREHPLVRILSAEDARALPRRALSAQAGRANDNVKPLQEMQRPAPVITPGGWTADTIPSVAAQTGLSLSRLYQLKKDGRLRFIRQGRDYLVSIDDALRHIATRQPGRPAKSSA